MDVTMFLFLLTAFSVFSSLITEGIKNIVKDKENLPTNIVALVVSLLVGSVGTGTYYVLNSIPFNANNIIYMILLGFANGLVAMVGYDKLMQSLNQLGISKKS